MDKSYTKKNRVITYFTTYIVSISLLAAQKCFCQPTTSITGIYQIKKYVSYNQVQQHDYKGTGSWVKFPCANCPVMIIKRDSIININRGLSMTANLRTKKDTSLTRLGAYITYTNIKGEFRAALKEFRIGQYIYVVYGNSANYRRTLRLTNKTDAGVYTGR